MTRRVWEEQLWSSNTPLTKRDMPTDHPMYGLPYQLRWYIADDLVLQPWALLSLAPIPREWEPLPADHEAAYLKRDGKVRVGLVDYSEGTVVAWQLTAGSAAYAPRQPKPRDADEPAADPIDRPRRSRAQRRTSSPP